MSILPVSEAMPYQSVDQLQKVLTAEVFHYAKDAKKAAGRALGTLVEIITFYTLKAWGFEESLAIERPLPEFANEAITHNVEYSLHPSRRIRQNAVVNSGLPLTARKILKDLEPTDLGVKQFTAKSNVLLTKDLLLKNCCCIAECGDYFISALLKATSGDNREYSISRLRRRPYAIFECKRVGIEEGMKKGPQTIEKAKQGAYVARTVSALQRIRMADGTIGGVIQGRDGELTVGNYYELLARVIASDNVELLERFILTVGVVSNHGNWFTSENHNKELKVLAQSYDWLLFLTDAGLSQFIDELLLNPDSGMAPARQAFLASYTGEKGKNQFTKVKISLAADRALQSYFKSKMRSIEGWFNVIAPSGGPLKTLKEELSALRSKAWEDIHG